MTEELLAKAYVKGALDLLQGKIDGMPKIVVIPDNATNGDILKMMFPSDANELNMSKLHLMYDGLDYIHEFRKDWWNSPYQKEVEE